MKVQCTFIHKKQALQNEEGCRDGNSNDKSSEFKDSLKKRGDKKWLNALDFGMVLLKYTAIT